MKRNTIARESFSLGNRHYTFGFKQAANGTKYVTITRIDLNKDGSTTSFSLVFFQEEFEFFISSFCSLLTTASGISEQEKTILDLFNERKQHKGTSGIKSWEVEKRPREKFLEYGPGILSNAELMAMLIGSGTAEETPVDLSQKILDESGNDLIRLSKLKHFDLARHKGMGIAKTSAILAALELGRRAFAVENNFNFIKGKKPIAKLRP